MAIPVGSRGSNPIGHAWLRRELSLAVPPPTVESYVVAGARRTEVRGRRIVEQYPRQYATRPSEGTARTFFPVSAAILRDRRSYDETLETFSRATLGLIRWRWTAAREIVVDNETADLYRYFDATAFAEYLHDRVADTVRRDLTEELAFIAVFDRACAAVREIVDMPDRRVALFVRLCMQNGGRLSAKKRRLFAELEDVEVDAMQASIGDALAAATPGP